MSVKTRKIKRFGKTVTVPALVRGNKRRILAYVMDFLEKQGVQSAIGTGPKTICKYRLSRRQQKETVQLCCAVGCLLDDAEIKNNELDDFAILVSEGCIKIDPTVVDLLQTLQEAHDYVSGRKNWFQRFKEQFDHLVMLEREERVKHL